LQRRGELSHALRKRSSNWSIVSLWEPGLTQRKTSQFRLAKEYKEISMNNVPQEISTSLRKLLNTHGHSFHFTVLRRAHQLMDEGRSPWIFDGAEFPVKAGGQTTHIDFILRSKSANILLIAECKRADPAKAIWCFVRYPYTWRNQHEHELVFEHFEGDRFKRVFRKPRFAYTSRNSGVYHLGYELKTNAKGDGQGGGQDKKPNDIQNKTLIDQGIAQVLRGTSGLINHFSDELQASEFPPPSSHEMYRISNQATSRTIKFIPVIFTTAQLWVSDADLGAADLTNGRLSEDAVKTSQVEWLWFNVHRSPGLKPDVNVDMETNDRFFKELSFYLRQECARSVAIVNANAIDSFLSIDMEEWLM
jgi:hypothetical protein